MKSMEYYQRIKEIQEMLDNNLSKEEIKEALSNLPSQKTIAFNFKCDYCEAEEKIKHKFRKDGYQAI